MAYTNVDVVHGRLDQAVFYAINPKKTCMREDGAIGASRQEVLGDSRIRMFASALNCSSPFAASSEMAATKKKQGKPDGVVGFTYVQSFDKGEVTPELAHKIGVEFAQRCFGAEYEAVVGTHFNTDVIHNHIVINSVSFVHGKKYRSNISDYFQNIRKVSDDLCREHGLSVIDEPKGRGRHYAEWKARKEGKPTVRGMVAADIDDAIHHSFTFQSFVEEMRRRGYTVQYDENHKYVTVKPHGGQRAIRLTQRSMGPEYTEEAIRARIEAQRGGYEWKPQKEKQNPPTPRRYRIAAPYTPRKRRKLKGFAALYYHYLYLLKAVRYPGRQKRLPPAIRKEVTKLEKVNRQFLYLLRNGITTSSELQAHRQALQAQIDALTKQRKPLYRERRDAGNEAETSRLSQEIETATVRLRNLRKARRVCDAILNDAPKVAENVKYSMAQTPQKPREKQEREKPDLSI